MKFPEQQQVIVQNGGPNLWSSVEHVVKDLLSQQIPASVVLLIIALILGPLAFRFWVLNSRRK